MRPFDDISRLEHARSLDKPIAAVAPAVQKALGNQKVKDFLHGTWLGHSLHATVVHGTLGSLLSASLIDLVGGKRSYSSALIGTGLATAPLTVAAGWADWSAGNRDQQRVGLVHAATNIVALSLYASALVSRARGGSGRLLSLSGLAVSSIGAAFGGHLAYHQSLGPNHADRVRDLAPSDWTPLGALDELPEGQPVRRDAGEAAVVVVRRGAGAAVLSNTCPHLAAPMADGKVEDGEIVCPWHDSRFRLSDGELVQGPAIASLPCFDTRVEGGVLLARRRDR
jgi:nitrite reductase/ring-hydroxylating ferredoxin subunit/uncharacterized membrane protein